MSVHVFKGGKLQPISGEVYDPQTYYTKEESDKSLAEESKRAIARENELEAKISETMPENFATKEEVNQGLENVNDRISNEINRATRAEMALEEKIAAGGGGASGDVYTKKEVDGLIIGVEDKVNQETSRATAKENEIDGKIRKVNTDISTINDNLNILENKTLEFDEKIAAETTRATEAENTIISKFSEYTPTKDLQALKVDEAVKADEAIKASQDGSGNTITDTYMLKGDTYSRKEIDSKISSVYNYKGSVATYNDLPTEFMKVGDVYDVQDTGSNYAWDGTKWDNLGGKVDLTNYLTKDVAASTYATKGQLSEETNRALAAEEAISAKLPQYALKENTISSAEVDNKIIVETNRATAKENEIISKFDNYTPTTELTLVKVDSATNADNAKVAAQAQEALKAMSAIKDAKDNIIDETYATKATTYTREEIDAKVSSVYKYKGAVENFESLPTENNTIGDVYDTLDTGTNYAWDGTKWDNLGTLVDLTPYLKTSDAEKTYATISSLSEETSRAQTQEVLLDEKFANYTPTVSIPAIKVTNAENADIATKAIQDGQGNNISETYATKDEVASSTVVDEKIKVETDRAIAKENEIDAKFSNYTITSEVPNIKVLNSNKADEATKATQDGNGAIISETYATKADTYTISQIDEKLSSVYKYKGSVDSYENLPTENNIVGDVYDVKSTGANYAWDGTTWDELGLTINLTEYLKKSEIEATYATKENLSTEADRAVARENEIDGKLINYQLKSEALKPSDIDDKIKVETDRATTKENELLTSINSEIERATQVESTIDGKFSNYVTTTSQKEKDDAQDRALAAEVERATKAEKVLEEKIAAGGEGGGLPPENYYTKTEIDEKWNTIPTIKVNEADKATQDGLGNVIDTTYAKKSEIISSSDIDTKVKVETDRATARENEIDTKFSEYSKTIDIPSIKVTNAENADNASKASRDDQGNIITNTYATKADTYTRKEIDDKVSAVYRYKGSVSLVSELPTEGNTTGDVWDVKSTGGNYAWNGKEWDALGDTFDLTPYLKKEEATSTYATKSDLQTVDSKFSNYTVTNSIHTIKVDEAIKASQDGNGKVISETYAEKTSVVPESEIDAKITVEASRAQGVENSLGSRISTLENTPGPDLSKYITQDTLDENLNTKVPSIKVDNAILADKATQDELGNNIAETYATKATSYTKEEIDSKVSSVYKYKGSVASFDLLPKEGNIVGDVYDVKDTDTNYAWDGIEWDSLGGIINLEPYATKEDVASTYATISSLEQTNNNFSNYTITSDLHTIKVDEAIKASQDGLGNNIAETYLKSIDAVTSDNVDEKIKVETDRATASETLLSGRIETLENKPDLDLTPYATTEALTAETDRAIARENAIEAKISEGGGIDVTQYYTKDEVNKGFISYHGEPDRIEDANTFKALGYALTKQSTTGLPEKASGYRDRWGVIQFIPENISNFTGTQLWFPIDGTYKGKVFTRSITNKVPGTWELIGDVDLSPYYTKTEIDEKWETIPTIKVNEAIKATQDSLGNIINTTYATIESLEQALTNYVTTENLALAKVAEATKAIQDGNGAVISETYATKADTYTKEEVDSKVSQVYRYKGSVSAYENLPSTDQVIGDVYNVEDTGDNYAWDGTTWDKLAGTVNLTEYLKKIEAEGIYATKESVSLINSEFLKYTPTTDIHTIKVDAAEKATNDGNGKNIANTYATQESLNAIDEKFANYTPTTGLTSVKVNNAKLADEATKATQDGLGNNIAETYALASTVVEESVIDEKIKVETDRASGIESSIDLRVSALELSDQNKPDMSLYYTSKQVDEKITTDVPNIKVNNAVLADKATQDSKGNTIDTFYASKTEVSTEVSRAIAKENELELKFENYTPTSDIPLVKVNEATKATQDSEGNSIIDTYATKATSYTKEEIDEKVSSVYKYKGSVAAYENLPLENNTTGDVYNVEADDSNYAWDGTKWDKLGGTVNLSEYLKKAEAESTYATQENLTLTDNKFSDYTKTSELHSVVIDEATKATQDKSGNIITDTYATKVALQEETSRATGIESGLETRVAALEAGGSGGGGTLPPESYYTKDQIDKGFVAYKGESERVKDADTFRTIGYGLTDTATEHLPTQVQNTKGRWGVLQFVPENAYRGTGTQIYYPIDGEYKGQMFLRSITNGIPGLWNLMGEVDLSAYDTSEQVNTKLAEYTKTIEIPSIKVNEAIKATQDALGNVINTTYATVEALEAAVANFVTSESLATAKVAEATKATQDGNGAIISETYFKASEIGNASVLSATKATQDSKGNIIDTFYASKTSLEDVNKKFNDYTKTSELASATVGTATKAIQDNNGNIITDTYATIANTYDKATIDEKLTTVYKFKGSVENFAALPLEGNTVGDVYDTLDTGTNYAWTGDKWDSLGGSSVDLSEYLKKAEAASTYATQGSLDVVDAKFASYTPSTDVHSIIVDVATKAMQDGNGAIITDTYVSNDALTSKLGDYATTASLADATVKKAGETDSISNITVGQGPWTVNFNPKGAANNPANFLWFDAKSNQIRNANTKSLNVNHSLKATQDNKGNVIDTFYAKGTELAALDERVTAIEAGGGGGTGPVLTDYLKISDAEKTYATITTVTGIDERVTAIEAGGGTGPDLKDYYKKSETYSQAEVNSAIKVETDRASQAEKALSDRVTTLETSGGGGGGTPASGDFILASGYEKVAGQGLDLNTPPKSCFFITAEDWDKVKHSPKENFGQVSGTTLGGAFFQQYSCGKDFILQEIKTVQKQGTAQCFEFHRSKVGGQWNKWVKCQFNEW